MAQVPCKDANQALASIGVPPDFDYDKTGQGTDVMFVHRRLTDGDIYFLSNRSERPQTLNATFRVTGKRPDDGWFTRAGEKLPGPFTGAVQHEDKPSQYDPTGPPAPQFRIEKLCHDPRHPAQVEADAIRTG